ncbi:ETEC_3214 domain-containing protein [Streptomyces sp. NPDC051956]|uniref:ETEC_3214 domain-containing protein n=1 Tax=Streptomyces sp. NPDC051956 TaxID=3365677 RepID=UPI0037CFDB78
MLSSTTDNPRTAPWPVSCFGESAWQHNENVEQYTSEQEVPGSTETLEMTVRTWPLGRMGFLVTWCTANDEVEMYSITTRSRIFRPTIRVGGRYLVRLGKSRLSALPYPNVIEDPVQWTIGSWRFSYAEIHYFGNPGAYRTWAMGVSDSGHPAAPPVELGSSPEYCNDPVEIPRYRARARINSVLVAGGSAIRLGSLLPDGVGPDHDRVRLADPEYGLRALCTRLRWQTGQAASHMRELVRRGSNEYPDCSARFGLSLRIAPSGHLGGGRTLNLSALSAPSRACWL